MDAVYQNWPKAGGMMAVIIVLVLFFFPSLQVGSFAWLFWLHLPILMLHQFEEYVFPGGFKDYANKMMGATLTDQKVFFVNVVIGWGVLTIAALVGMNAVWFPASMVCFIGLNAMMHVLVALLKREYNPGAVVSLIVNIPFAAFVMYCLVIGAVIGTLELIVAIAGGALGNGALLIYIRRKSSS